MPKPSPNTPREQEVLDSPDGFIVRVLIPQRGWEESAIFGPTKVLWSVNEVRKLGYRAYIAAIRKFGDELRIAFVTDAYVSALIELNVNEK